MKLTITVDDIDKINKLAKTNESVASALEQLLTVYALVHKPEIEIDNPANNNDDDYFVGIF